MATGSLSEREESILDFERSWPAGARAKEQAIRSQFALSPARYYQVLGRLIETPQALAFDPMLVKRLLRQRDARRAARLARTRPLIP